MKDLQQRVENWLVRRPNSDFVWIAAAFFLLSLGISGIWEMWIVGLITGLAFVLLVRLALRQKLNILKEPLRLSTNAVRQRVNGRDVVQVRAMLGRGRMVRPIEVKAWWEDEQTEVRTEWTPEVVIGPWTVTVTCAHARGRLQLELMGQEGRETHTVSGEWDLELLTSGRFVPVGDWKSGRFCGSSSNWDTVEPCGSSLSAQL